MKATYIFGFFMVSFTIAIPVIALLYVFLESYNVPADVIGIIGYLFSAVITLLTVSFTQNPHLHHQNHR